MRQALHIFKKDARHLRWEIALVLAATALTPYTNSNTGLTLARPAIFLTIVWWFLAGRAIHAEPLPGQNQFWLTRPYSRASLLGAKLLLLFSALALPMAVADLVALKSHGLQASEFWPGLIFEQFLRVAVIALPAAVLACITRTTKSYVAVTVIGGIFISELIFGAHPVSWGILGWLQEALLIGFTALACFAVLVWQYARRKTWIACIGFAGLILIGSLIVTLPAKDGWLIAGWFSPRWWRGSWVTVTLDPPASPPTQTSQAEPPIALRVDLPLRILGLPKGVTPRAEEVNVLEFPARSFWEFDSEGKVHQIMIFPAALSDRVVDLHVSAVVTLTRPRQAMTIPIVNGRAIIPGVAVCQSGPMLCRSVFRPPPVMTFIAPETVAYRDHTGWVSYSPFPAELSFDPLNDYWSGDPSVDLNQINVSLEEPVAHLPIDFTLQGVRLGDYGTPVSDARLLASGEKAH